MGVGKCMCFYPDRWTSRSGRTWEPLHRHPGANDLSCPAQPWLTRPHRRCPAEGPLTPVGSSFPSRPVRRGFWGAPPHSWASLPLSVKESRTGRGEKLRSVQSAVVSTHGSAQLGVPHLVTPSPCLIRDCSKSKNLRAKGVYLSV